MKLNPFEGLGIIYIFGLGIYCSTLVGTWSSPGYRDATLPIQMMVYLAVPYGLGYMAAKWKQS